MPQAAEQQDEFYEASPTLFAPGTAVVTLGQDETGHEALAVWQVSSDGNPTGAWIRPQESVYCNTETAREVLTQIERRALVDTELIDLDKVIGRITQTAEIEAESWWTEQTFSPVAAFADIVDRRSQFQSTISTLQKSGRKATSLKWSRSLPEKRRVTTIADLQKLADIGKTPGSPVAAEALQMARTLKWMLATWSQTEQVKNRRKYISEEHGEPESLPPSWLHAVTIASGTRLPL